MALIRVKRRLQDDPIDLLLFSCKKPKTEENPVTKVFKFATTINDQSSRKHFQGKEAFHRMNYLYQATDFSRKLPGRDGLKLMMHFGDVLNNVARKTVTRHDVTLKRRICKNCHCVLVPGDTCIVRLLRKPQQQIMWLCNVCGTYKLFNTRPEHTVWTEKPEAIVEIIECTPNVNNCSEEKVCGQVVNLTIKEQALNTS